jgi:Tfp pilus assembly protein PilN
MEVSSFSEIPVHEMIHDAAEFEWTSGTRQILMALTRSEKIAQAIQTAAALKINVYGLVSTPVAIFNGMVNDSLSDERPTLFIRLGVNSTDVAIGTCRGLLFARSFASGAATLPETLNTLVSTVAIYRREFAEKASPVENIYITGEGSLITGTAAALASRLELPVSPLPEKKIPPAFAVAYGLALSGFASPVCPISFLPDAIKHETVFRKSKPYWFAATVFGFLTLALITFSGFLALSRENAGVNQESRHIATIKELTHQLDSLHQNEKAIRDYEKAIRSFDTSLLPLLRSHTTFRDAIMIATRSVHATDWLTSLSISDKGVLALEGMTPRADLANVNALLKTLSESACLSGVTLIHSEPVLPGVFVQEPVEVVTRFTIQATLYRP